MGSLLILSPVTDLHANIVGDKLRLAGHSVSTLDYSDLPTNLSATIEFSGGKRRERISGDLELDFSKFTSVWLRRPSGPGVRPDRFHPDDRPRLELDWAIFLDWIMGAVAPGANWINRYGPHIRASNKILQYREAIAAGLEVPKSIFSSTPSDIRAFLASCSSVHKPIGRHPAGADGNLRFATAEIESEHLPQDDLLRLQPCFLQERVDKVSELRVHVFGGKVVAILLQPRTDPGQIDWNTERENFSASLYQLPASMEDGCRNLVKTLGLSFACMDFAVRSDGKAFFLELNQMGQFLWLNDMAPQARLIEEFSLLLMGSAAND